MSVAEPRRVQQMNSAAVAVQCVDCNVFGDCILSWSDMMTKVQNVKLVHDSKPCPIYASSALVHKLMKCDLPLPVMPNTGMKISS